MTSTSEVLNRAADLIEERGWVRGNDGMIAATDSPLCILGAIGAAAGIAHGEETRDGKPCYDYPATQECPAGVAVRHYLGVNKPFLWNDHRERTAADVVEVLRAAAVIEAARENADAPVEVAS